MPRFFFNIRENGVLRRDYEGVVCVDAAQACVGAEAAMRDFARETEAVVMLWPVVLEVADGEGNVITTISAEKCLQVAEDRRHLSFCS